jgi:hypothetical protein
MLLVTKFIVLAGQILRWDLSIKLDTSNETQPQEQNEMLYFDGCKQEIPETLCRLLG